MRQVDCLNDFPRFERERIVMREATILAIDGVLAAIIVAGVLVHFLP
jgi:hypothetical protein